MTLRESKQLIRRWISERFSDERLAQVYAFNQDGKMRFLDPCGCFLGVTGAEKLHEGPDYVKGGYCSHLHYLKMRDFDNDGQLAENAYNALGYVSPIDRRCRSRASSSSGDGCN